MGSATAQEAFDARSGRAAVEPQPGVGSDRRSSGPKSGKPSSGASDEAAPNVPVKAAGAAPRSALRAVALPSEHGGWSLTAEPVILGLVIAWSWAGFAIGLATMLAFVARTPLKVYLVDRFRQRSLPRTSLALKVFGVELAAIIALSSFAVVATDRSTFWLPLLLAAPLAVTELWFDMRSRGRRLIPELAGAVGISASVAIIALAGGTSWALALGLWLVVSARAVAAIPYVLTQLKRFRGLQPRLWPSDAVQVAAAVAVAGAVVLRALPVAPAVAVGLISVFNIASVRMAPRRAVLIGIQQSIYGLLCLTVTAVAVLAGGVANY